MIFKKTYTIDVEIDLEKCSNDPEWAIENWELDNGGELLQQMYDDIYNFVEEKGLR